MISIQHYINGDFVDSTSGKSQEHVSPTDGKAFARLALGGDEDIEKAVQAGKNAFPLWSKMSKQKRSDILQAISKRILENKDELAKAESMDNGKPLHLANAVDIPRAASNMSFFATAILHDHQEAFEMDGFAQNYTIRKPLGVVGCISPWNLPLYLFTWKIAPALASGNCVVAKPSEITPYTAYLFAEICKECGLPDGVLNIVHGLGHEAGEALVSHPEIKAISFTGGTKTGAHIAQELAPTFKKTSLELGGKNPVLVFEDCDFEKMIKGVIKSSFANQGQICLCGSRIFVEESIYNKFIDRFVQETKQLKVGHPIKENVDLGAVVSEDHMNKILSYVELAKKEGGTILAGGKRAQVNNGEGFYLEPTIISGLDNACRTNQEEIFGPVVSVMPFINEEEGLALANHTPYGLSAVIWSDNLSRTQRLAQELDCGIVWINTWLLRDLRTPFGGTKHSGVGREGGFEALHFFTETKNICLKI